MTDIPISVDLSNPELAAIAQPDDDGRARTVQETLDGWAGTYHAHRRFVLQALWQSEQRLTQIAIDESQPASRRAWARNGVKSNRAARYVLRALANAMDPKPVKAEVLEAAAVKP